MKIVNLSKESKAVQLLTTIIIGIIGGKIFIFLHMPLSWVLGPMTALLVCSRLDKIHLFWSPKIRNFGLIIIGYAAGLSVNNDTLSQIIRQLPWMLVMTVALIAFSAVTALLIAKLTGVDYPSALAGGAPGGLSQMVALGEEMKGANLTVITFLQVVRIILIVFFIPLIISSPFYSAEKSTYIPVTEQAVSLPLDVLVPRIILFTIISVVFAAMAKKFKFPTPYFLGPILGIAILNTLGLHGPKPSPLLLDIAQFTMGCHLGLLLKPEKLKNKVKIFTIAIVNGLVLILFSLGLSYVLVKMHGLGAATSFLAMAPGGADQMSVIASVISADVSIVTSYQLFRILLVNTIIPPVLKWFYRYNMKIKQANNSLDSSGE